MTCEELKERLIESFEGGARTAVDAHLAVCAACRAEAEAIAEVWELLGRWPDEDPPADLKGRVLGVPAGLGVGPRRQEWRTAAAYLCVAAAVALLAVGAWLGGRYTARSPMPSEDGRERFMLLLYEDTLAEAEYSPDEVASIVEEYKRWAREVRDRGSLEGGDKLTDERRVLAVAGPELQAGVALGGYFVIRADSFEEAAEIARSCPHLAHGGTIELRRIDPV